MPLRYRMLFGSTKNLHAIEIENLVGRTGFGIELELIKLSPVHPPPSTPRRNPPCPPHLLERFILADPLDRLGRRRLLPRRLPRLWTFGVCRLNHDRHYATDLLCCNVPGRNPRSLLGAIVADRGFDRVLSQHGAVNFHRGQAQLIHDLRVLDRFRLPSCPLAIPWPKRSWQSHCRNRRS